MKYELQKKWQGGDIYSLFNGRYFFERKLIKQFPDQSQLHLKDNPENKQKKKRKREKEKKKGKKKLSLSPLIELQNKQIVRGAFNNSQSR